jgi:hypothetical protein
MPPPPRPALKLLVAVVDQRIEAGHRLHHDVAAAPSVAAVGAAELDEFLPPERDAAVSAGARLDVDLRFVEEFHAVTGKARNGKRQSAASGRRRSI